MKKIALFILAAFLIIALPAYAAAKQVTFSSESGESGDTVTVLINVDNLVDIAGYNIDFTYDSTVLTATGAAIGADATGTFIPNVGTAGEIKLGLINFAGNTSTSFGELATVTFNILAHAYKNSTLTFTRTDLKAENGANIAGTTSTNGSVAVTGVTTTVLVTPASTTDVVAGQAVPLTAEVLINGAHLDLTSTDDITFVVTSGNGTMGAKSLTDGKVQVDYTTHTTIESATITATENVTGGANQDMAEVTSIVGTLATLTVSPDTKTLTADDAQQFTVTGVDANGNTAKRTIHIDTGLKVTDFDQVKLTDDLKSCDVIQIKIANELLQIIQVSEEREKNIDGAEQIKWFLNSALDQPLENYYYDFKIFKEDDAVSFKNNRFAESVNAIIPVLSGTVIVLSAVNVSGTIV